jgi:hypothetical protein
VKKTERVGAYEGNSVAKCLFYSAVFFFLCLPQLLHAQEYLVRAIDAKSRRVLKGIPVTLRYACTATGSGVKTRVRCKFIQRKTGADGIAHFPEAGSLDGIDDIFSISTRYIEVCCDISNPVIPGIGTITLKRLSIWQTLHWIFIGD